MTLASPIADCTGIVLAGGRSRRFSGINKALVRLGSKRLIDHILETLNACFTRTLLVTKNPMDYLPWDVSIVSDILPVASSLTGIHAGLFYCSTPYAFITACDTPFIRPGIIALLAREISASVDVVIPETSAGLEPLCAIYAVGCLHRIDRHLKSGRLTIRETFDRLRVRRIPEKRLKTVDPELTSFININSPDDLQRAAHLK